MALETRFAKFLVERIQAKVESIPRSENQQETLIYVHELSAVIDQLGGEETPVQPRRTRRQRSGGNADEA